MQLLPDHYPQPPTPTPYGASTRIAKRSGKTNSATAEKVTMSTATTAHDLKPSRTKNEAVHGPCSSLHHCHREGQPAQASKSAVRASRGAGHTGNARGVQGVVWHHGRRVSAVEGTKTNPLLMCTVTASDIGQHRESQTFCHRGEGNERSRRAYWLYARNKDVQDACARGAGPKNDPLTPSVIPWPRCAPAFTARRT